MSYAAFKHRIFHFENFHIALKCIDILAPCDAVSFLEGNDVTGLKVWTGSLLFCEYVKQNSHQFVNKSVLELGSGAGLLGIYLSHFCGTPLVVTDGNDEVLQLLQQNIELNRPLPREIKCEKLRWGEKNDIQRVQKLWSNGFDVVVGADIIYTADSLESLIDTVQKLLAENGLFLLLYISRSSQLDEVLMKSITSRHFSVQKTVIPQTFEDNIWYELFDPTTNRLFYANPATGACTWIRPNVTHIINNQLPEWWELYDEGSGNAYYYNSYTKETFWEKPPWLTVHPIPLSSADDAKLRNVLGPPPPLNEAPQPPTTTANLTHSEDVSSVPYRTEVSASIPPSQTSTATSTSTSLLVQSTPPPPTTTTTATTSVVTNVVSDPPKSMDTLFTSELGSQSNSSQPQPTATPTTTQTTTPPPTTTATIPTTTTESTPSEMVYGLVTSSTSLSPQPSTETIPTTKQTDSSLTENKSNNDSLPPWWDLANPTWLNDLLATPFAAYISDSTSTTTPSNVTSSSSSDTTSSFTTSSLVNSNLGGGPSAGGTPSTSTSTSTSSTLQSSATVHTTSHSEPLQSNLVNPSTILNTTDSTSKPQQSTSLLPPPPPQESTSLVSATTAQPSDSNSLSSTSTSSTFSDTLLSGGTLTLLPQQPLDLHGRPPFDSVSLHPSNIKQSTPSPSVTTPTPTKTTPYAVTSQPSTSSPFVIPTTPTASATSTSTSAATTSTSSGITSNTNPIVTSHSASVMPIISSLSASTPASNPNTPTEFSLTFSQQPTLVLRPPQTFHSSHPHTVSQTSPSLVLSGYRDSSPGRSAPVLTRVQSSFLPHMSNRTPPIPPVSKPRSVSTSSSNAESPASNLSEHPKMSEPPKVSEPPKMDSPPTFSPQLKQEINLFQLEGYAKKYFQTVKKGIFKRTIPLKNLLKWSKDTIPHSLLKMKDKLSKEAVGIFKLLQMYMGDKAIRRDPSAIAQQMLEKVINIPELRDELYCQICKQTTLNPNLESTYKGWDLMALIVQYVPPTKDLEGFLYGYIREHLKLSDEKLRQYATFCLKKLPRTCRIGARGRIPTIKEIERSKVAPFDLEIFGGTLQSIMLQQEKKLKTTLPTPYFYPLFYGQIPVIGSNTTTTTPNNNNNNNNNNNLFPPFTPQSAMSQIQGYPLPIVLITMTDAVYFLNGHNTEGIFRVSGDAEEIATMKMQIEAGDYTVRSKDPHLPASVLKQWLRDLEESVIPEHLYDKCIAAAKEEDVNKALAILNELPDINKRVLHYLIKFLQVMLNPEYQQKTKMSINNIAMIFGPCILRCPSDQPSVIFESTKFEQVFVRLLILGVK